MPGVSEAAGLVVILINLATDNRGNAAATDQTMKRCRSIIIMLNRAAEVLGKNVSHRHAALLLLESPATTPRALRRYAAHACIHSSRSVSPN